MDRNNKNICRISNIRSGDLICTEFVYETEIMKTERSLNNSYLVGFICSGDGRFYSGKKEYSLKRGSVFFVPKNGEYRLDFNENCTYFYISFFGRRGDEIVDRTVFAKGVSAADLSSVSENIIEFALGAIKKVNDNNLDIFGESVLLYLLGHVVGEDGNKGDLMSAIISATNEHFSSHTFSLSTLADILGYDAKYISSYFKKKKGMCFSEYLRDIRIRHSVFLMEQGVVYVRNVAILSGFSDAMYYSRGFKAVMGVSPSNYIKTLTLNVE